ncbi:hypothetical protein J761_3874 [Acinetobacter baumannii 24845_8]|nr:hypothetical protein J761_3874 [Acinetobacter baumannii 24845_8]
MLWQNSQKKELAMHVHNLWQSLSKSISTQLKILKQFDEP